MYLLNVWLAYQMPVQRVWHGFLKQFLRWICHKKEGNMHKFSSEVEAIKKVSKRYSRYIIGNWKVRTKSNHQAMALVDDIVRGFSEKSIPAGTKIVLCPSFTQLYSVYEKLSSAKQIGDMSVGAQDCSLPKGATGDVPAELLASVGVEYVLLGHSERRIIHGEGSAEVKSKTCMAIQTGLIPIVCVGETLIEHNKGQVKEALFREITESLPKNFVGLLAYEPIWAVGAVDMASTEQIKKSLMIIREILQEHLTSAILPPLLYGGAVMTGLQAAAVFQTGVDGILIGRASVCAEQVLDIVHGSA
ncbi:triosephosphate isomerase [Acetobacteraceae bacterium]|nr:triosephosphate isomerase [Acetobacteraceae bacterium]